MADFLKKEGKTVKQGKVVRTKASRGEDGKIFFDLDSTDDEAEVADEKSKKVDKTSNDQQKVSTQKEISDESSSSRENTNNKTPSSSTTNQNTNPPPQSKPKSKTPPNTSISPPKILETINLKLRIRTGHGAENQLNDIGFPFNPETDTPDSLAQELCQASLVSLADQIVVSVAMAECLETGQEQTFKLNTRDENCESDVEELQGYARIYVDK